MQNLFILVESICLVFTLLTLPRETYPKNFFPKTSVKEVIDCSSYGFCSYGCGKKSEKGEWESEIQISSYKISHGDVIYSMGNIANNIVITKKNHSGCREWSVYCRAKHVMLETTVAAVQVRAGQALIRVVEVKTRSG